MPQPVVEFKFCLLLSHISTQTDTNRIIKKLFGFLAKSSTLWRIYGSMHLRVISTVNINRINHKKCTTTV